MPPAPLPGIGTVGLISKPTNGGEFSNWNSQSTKIFSEDSFPPTTAGAQSRPGDDTERANTYNNNLTSKEGPPGPLLDLSLPPHPPHPRQPTSPLSDCDSSDIIFQCWTELINSQVTAQNLQYYCCILDYSFYHLFSIKLLSLFNLCEIIIVGRNLKIFKGIFHQEHESINLQLWNVFKASLLEYIVEWMRNITETEN